MSALITRRTALSVLALPAGSMLSGPAGAEESDDSYLREDYLERARRRDPDGFVSGLMEKRLPGTTQLWLLPPNLLVSSVRRSSWVYVNGSSGKFATASFLRELPKPRVIQLAREFPDALCEPAQPWFLYRVWHRVTAKTLVLGMPTKPSGVKLGMKRIPVPPAVVARALAPSSKAMLTLSEGLQGPEGAYRLSLSAAYDTASNGLLKMSVALHRADWSLIARHQSVVTTWCDGCLLPSRALGLGPVFGALNLMQVDGLPYPVLLADRSSIENRTLMMSTFTQQHQYARHALSFMFVGCPSLALILGDGASDGR